VLRKATEELPGLLRLESSIRLAAPRLAALKRLLSSVEEEAGELLY